MSTVTTKDFIRVAALPKLQEKGCLVVRGEDRPIAVFYHCGKVHAVDNRCPHMGFPLHRGTVNEGILTCHWHHARFDLTSGCTFDLFADDVPSYPVEVRDGEVWVGRRPRQADPQEYGRRRLQEGMSQNIGLIIAKAVLNLLQAGVDYRDIVQEGVLFGARYRDGWASGMTILTSLANLIPDLPEEERFLALYQGLRRVAADCAGQSPRRDRYPLENAEVPRDTLRDWLRRWAEGRHRDGAERTVLTALQQGASPAEMTDFLFSVALERIFADTGHALDFQNKAFEALELIGWEQAEKVLPTVIPQLVSARGGEESNSWRHPVDLVQLLEQAFPELPAWFKEGQRRTWKQESSLAQDLLGDDPARLIEALGEAIRQGAQPTQLSQALAYAAALRIARFGRANEFGDWITALHTFSYCNALHQGLKRGSQGTSGTALQTPGFDLVRGVFHGALAVYLDRFLNVPPAPLPGERDSLEEESTDPEALRGQFLEALDTQQQMDRGARVVARYLDLGHPVEPLLGTLARGVLREDADFHTFQMLEASVQQYREWGSTPEGRNILVALARYLAAHAPTQRAQLQTAGIALRLHRGEDLYEEEDPSG